MKINGIVTANITKIDDIFLSSMSKVSGITLPVATSPYIIANGGTVSRNGDYLVHTFLGSDTFNVTSLSSTPAYNSLQYLIVAGGGGGGASVLSGGGGGAGGFLTGALTPTVSSYFLVIGAGGATTNGEGDGANGFNSTGLSLTSFGGGGGARGYVGYYPAGNGGSGGGAGALNGGAGLNGYPGTGTVGQGFDGGYAYGGPGYAASGAGGGAGAVGNNADGSQGGNGGPGQFSLISGTSIYYAGGGAGGSYAGAPGTGGIGGGGNGTNSGTGGNGSANLGAGGGGGKTTSSGGSGIAILSYYSPQTEYIVANGGTESRDGDYLIRTFTSTDTLDITNAPSNALLEYLIIAGGGAGGDNNSVYNGGGGGAGGVLTGSVIPTIGATSVIIGSGGAVALNSTSGSVSSLLGFTATGGGAGGNIYIMPTNQAGKPGGSGGGGSGSNSFPLNGGTGITGQGSNGGDGTINGAYYNYTGGGGGGYSQQGGTTNVNLSTGNQNYGGNGIQSSITGTAVYYAGGGGGGISDLAVVPVGGLGGLGGGGNGGFPSNATAGTINKGAGGGGSGYAYYAGIPKPAGNGGSGVVIIRYLSPQTYVQAFTDTVINRGGSLTANEITYLTTFEASVGEDLAEFDRLYIHGLSDNIAARTSFVNPSSTLITAVNSPTFNPYIGYQSNGITSYLDHNVTEASLVKYTQNSNSFFLYSHNNITEVANEYGIYNYPNLTAAFINSPSFAYLGNNFLIPEITQTANLNSVGLFECKRTGSLLQNYKNATLWHSYTASAQPLQSYNIFSLARNNPAVGAEVFSTKQHGLIAYGSGLINTVNFNNSVQTLGTSLGWFSYTTKFKIIVLQRGGTLTASEEAYLRTFETSMGSDLAEFDRLWVHGLSNEIAAKTSFVNPESTAVTAVNSPTFTAYRGYQSNGSTSYLNLNYNPYVDSVKFTNVSESFGSYYSENPALTFAEGGYYTTRGLYIYNDSLSFRVNMCSNNDYTTGVPFSNGLNYGIRDGAFSNSVIGATTNTALNVPFAGIPDGNLYGLCFSSNGSPALFLQSSVICSIKFIGSSNFNKTNFYNSIQTLGTSLGWFSYTTRFKAVVLSRGGSLTASEETYLNAFETSLGTDIKEFDRLWIHGLSDSIAARTSFVNPSSTLITAVNSPTFTPSLGYQGNGVNSYLNTNFNPATQAVKFTSSSGSMGVYVNTVSSTDGALFGQIDGLYSNIFYRIYPNSYAYLNYAGGAGSSKTDDGLGLIGAYKTNTSQQYYFKNGVTSSPDSCIGSPLVNGDLGIFCRFLNGNPYDSFTNGGISLSFVSSGNINQSNFYNSVQTLGTSIGWFTSKFKEVVVSRGGSLTSAEESYLRTFEASMGSDLVEFDRLWIHGLSNERAAKNSFVNPTSTAITAVNGPTFTPNAGYVTNGSTSYLDTNYNPATQGVKYTLNNASGFAYIRNNNISNCAAFGSFDGSNTGAFLYPQIYANQPIFYVNNIGGDSYATGDAVGLTTINRKNVALVEFYKNAAYITGSTRTATAIASLNEFVLGFNYNTNPYINGNPGTISVSGFGSSAFNQSNFYNALQTLGTYIGWAVIQNNISAFNRPNDNTTNQINSTGAKLIVITCTSYSLGNFPTISDNLGNMWIAVGFADGSQAARISTFYCINPTTSSSHTFTVVAAGGYPSISVNTFSGANFAFDKYSSNTGGNLTTISSGSITPSSSKNLVITAVNYWVAGGTPNSISDDFLITNSIPAQSFTLSGSTAYKLNSGTVNPTWSWTDNSGDTAAMITSFTY